MSTLPVLTSSTLPRRLSRVLWFGLIAVQAGCGREAGSAAEEGVPRWVFSEELRIGTVDGIGPDAFSEIRGLLVDDASSIYVLDWLAQEIRVFDSDGAHVRSFGGQGRGPGEFLRASGMAWGPGGTIYVDDPGNGRLSVFTRDGAFVEVVRRFVAGYSYIWSGGVDSAGRIYDFSRASLTEIDLSPGAKTSTEGLVLIRLDRATGRTDTIPFPWKPSDYFRLGRGTSSVPFGAENVWCHTGERLLYGHSSEYRITALGLGGDTLAVYGRPHTPLPVTRVEREKAIDGIRRFMRQMGETNDPDWSVIPTHRPAFLSFVSTEEGGLWVRRAQPEPPTTYDIFDALGTWVGFVDVEPPHWPLPRPVVTGDHVYLAVRDSLDVAFVLKARVRAVEGT